MKTFQHHCFTLGADLVAEEDVDGAIAFFRGIPYASLAQRWTQSSVQHALPTPFDATKYGPKCPQPPHASLIQVEIPTPVVEADELKCLNLNVTSPLEALREGKATRLPVMVWVHG